MGAGAYPSCHGERGGVHPEPVYHRDKHTHGHTHSTVNLGSPVSLEFLFFELCEEARVPGENQPKKMCLSHISFSKVSPVLPH